MNAPAIAVAEPATETHPLSAADPSRSPAPAPTTEREISDEELERKWLAAKARAREMSRQQQPLTNVTSTTIAALAKNATDTPAPAGALGARGVWEPPCTSCGTIIGYTAPEGKYCGATECAGCRAGSIDTRLAQSGIHLDEINEPLDGLEVTSPEFARWLGFLRTFAALTPGQRMKFPFALACGSNGVGKSAGAQRALRDAIRNGCQGLFIKQTEMIRSIYGAYDSHRRDETAEDRMRLYSSIHLLIVDELGGDTGDHAQGLFFDIIDDRLGNMRPTIFTSNYLPSADSLGARITDRTPDPTRMHGILSRIRGGMGDQLFVIKGRDMRQRKGRS